LLTRSRISQIILLWDFLHGFDRVFGCCARVLFAWSEFLLFAGCLVFFFAFIPAIGPAFVWVPTLVYYLAIGDYFTAGGLIVLGFILSFLIDAVLRAKVLGEKSKINPLLMIVGILGGISVFGVFGFIIGPLVLLYTLEILQAVLTAKD
jgi:predicted PurR-regulated permease PerM